MVYLLSFWDIQRFIVLKIYYSLVDLNFYLRGHFKISSSLALIYSEDDCYRFCSDARFKICLSWLGFIVIVDCKLCILNFVSGL